MNAVVRVLGFATVVSGLVCLSTAPALSARVATSREIFSLIVPAAANVFAAGVGGLKANGGGKKPTVVELPTLNNPIVFTSVLGTVSCCNGETTYNDPAGGTNAGGSTDIQSSGGISGIIHRMRTMFVTGVFLGYPGPQPPGPQRRDVTYDAGKPDIYPMLDQTFYIGNGKLLASGPSQRFHVPHGANRLVLGFTDAYSFHGPPSYGDDDLGNVAVKFQVSPTR